MSNRAPLFAVALVALGAGVFLALQKRESPSPARSPSAAEPPAPGRDEAELASADPVESASKSLEPASAVDEERTPAEVEAPAAATEPRLAELRGRLIDEDGAPLAGATLKVHGWGANSDRVRRFGEPEDWKDPAGESDGDGRFALRFDPPRAFQFVLDAKAPGRAEASWRWGDLPPGEVKDLGDVTLPIGGAIDVRIVDANGETLTKGWTVYADAVRSRELGGGRDETTGRAFVANADGVFRIEDMPPGPATVIAHSRIANWIDGPTVQVRAGETVSAEIRYAGPDNSRRITVVTFSQPFHVVDAEAESIHLFAADGTKRTAAHIAGSSQSNSFDDLPDGEYRVEIDDERFLPWSKEGVRPGESVNAHLKGSATLVLEVFDDATGAALADWSALLRFENVNFSPREFALVEPEGEPPAAGVLDGIVPGDFTLLVAADGFGEGSATIDALSPGETRRVVVRLAAPGVIAGVVRHGDGAPIPFIDVLLMAHEGPPDGEEARPDPSRDWRRRQEAKAATTDEAGRFAFDALRAGTYDLLADAKKPMVAELEAVVVRAGETTNVALSTPPRSFLSGRCLAPESASLDGLRIELERRGEEPAGVFDRAKSAAEIEHDGHYRVGPVPPGDYAVLLKLPDLVTARGNTTWRLSGKTTELGEATLAPGDNGGHDLDLRAVLPGRMRVVATRGEEPAAGWTATALLVRDSSSEASGRVVFGEESAMGELDARGMATLKPLFAGDYVVQLEGGGKTVVAPDVVRVEPGGDANLSVDARTYAGTISVVDADTGEPVEKGRVAIQALPPVEGLRFGSPLMVTTDASGRAEVELAPGAYRVFDGSNPFLALLGGDHGARLDWGPGGPAQAVILMPSAEKSGVPNPFAEAAKKAKSDGD